MKLAIPVSGPDLAKPVESRFGRAPSFLIYDTAKASVEYIDNKQQLNAPQGAGVQAAVQVAQSGAGVLICEHLGPKAFKVLEKAGLELFTSNGKTIQQVLDAYRKKELTPLSNADVEGHWV